MVNYEFVGEETGMSPAEYGYLWIQDSCLMHQWCSGAREVDQEVVDYCESLVEDVRENVKGEGKPDYNWSEDDLQNLETLLRYLKGEIMSNAWKKFEKWRRSITHEKFLACMRKFFSQRTPSKSATLELSSTTTNRTNTS